MPYEMLATSSFALVRDDAERVSSAAVSSVVVVAVDEPKELIWVGRSDGSLMCFEGGMDTSSPALCSSSGSVAHVCESFASTTTIAIVSIVAWNGQAFGSSRDGSVWTASLRPDEDKKIMVHKFTPSGCATTLTLCCTRFVRVGKRGPDTCAGTGKDSVVVGCEDGSVKEFEIHQSPEPSESRNIDMRVHFSVASAVTSVASVEDVSNGSCLIAAGADNGSVSLWNIFRIGTSEDPALLWETHCFPGAYVSCIGVVCGGDARTSLWIGSGGGGLVVIDLYEGGIDRQPLAHVEDVGRAVTAIVPRREECIVWTTTEDGRVVGWDPSNAHEIARFAHPSNVVGMVPACRAPFWSMWAVGRDGFAQTFLSQCISLTLSDDADGQQGSPKRTPSSTSASVELLLDNAVMRIERLQEEVRQQRLRSIAAESQMHALLVADEAHGRGQIMDMWVDTTELLFVQYLLAERALSSLSSECSALSAERSHFQSLMAYMSEKMMHASPPRSQTTKMAVGVQSSPYSSAQVHDPYQPPLHQPAPIADTSHMQTVIGQLTAAVTEREEQVRILQQELLRIRRETDRELERVYVERRDEAQTLRTLGEEQRRAVQKLQDALSVKESLLSEAREEVQTLRRETKDQSNRLLALSAELAQRESLASQGSANILALHVELNEIKLEFQKAVASHETERTRLLQDLHAMRLPWEAMKRALHEKELQLQAMRHQDNRAFTSTNTAKRH